ncbi:MAG: decaprenyl-phosphate phosphoribosyltransferase [Thiomicrorhabdus chilensis]|uniref:decaprenyl-phosphate phosphoribosyltransferase n=1 Tax=Thiomicrorhabdus chilensis TaxID=63656 RepID=UPI00299D190E|nr:decaprenyl-phosphate phosphoribosyltransferase [Thiomicrorhabdus chilensis]MDX1346625.1 decaprenyl-phosphate phosphoribosyltransferase [Thiomicrorhabdus chilensis]
MNSNTNQVANKLDSDSDSSTLSACTPASSERPVVLGLIRLMRPRQWIKNAFVLAPLIFAGQFLELYAVSQALLAFVLFSLASSATYIINDLRDIEEDRKHPVKSIKRPLASGWVKPVHAYPLLAVLYAVLIGGFFVQPEVMGVIVSYLLLNLAYSYWLKYQPVLDIFTIAIGFVLRVYAGAMAIDVPVSSWMFVTTLSLALFLAAIKRRQELTLSGEAGRKVLKMYSVSIVDKFAEISATGALLFYSFFVMSARPELVVTVPFVLFGLFRYWYIVEFLGEGESPTDALLTDKQLMLTVLGWVLASLWALWPTGMGA